MSLSIIIILMAVSATQLTSMVTLDGNALTPNNLYAKYSDSQTQSLVNDCGVGDSDGSPICTITSPQTLADGTVSAPLVSISGGGQGQGQGPQGPKGEQGEQGPPGPAGPEGPPGPQQELVVRSAQSDLEQLAAKGSTEVKALCESDEVVTGGGLVNDQRFGPGAGLANEINPSYNSKPDEAENGWQVEFFNPGPELARTQAYAQCAKLVDAP